MTRGLGESAGMEAVAAADSRERGVAEVADGSRESEMQWSLTREVSQRAARAREVEGRVVAKKAAGEAPLQRSRRHHRLRTKRT
mmetsp:Transcript_93161/g.234683  ORF Transcript_93161/g.234683 Transcript_93161/m.234683 type:complete len:84 (+) Transcript_93161:187-438(+)